MKKEELKEMKHYVGDNLRLAWYFEKPIEKIMIVLAMLCLVLTILRLIITRRIW